MTRKEDANDNANDNENHSRKDKRNHSGCHSGEAGGNLLHDCGSLSDPDHGAGRIRAGLIYSLWLLVVLRLLWPGFAALPESRFGITGLWEEGRAFLQERLPQDAGEETHQGAVNQGAVNQGTIPSSRIIPG